MRFLLPLVLLATSVFAGEVGFEQKLVVDGLANGATFGNSVDVSGDTAVVAAWQDKVGRKIKQGTVHVFVKRQGRWINQAKLIAFDGKQRDLFGTRVAIDGDTIVVGVPEADIGKDRNQGAAYVFTRVGNNWEKQEKLVAAGGAANALFGGAVAVSGDTILIGAPGADSNPNDNVPQANGAIYVFKKMGKDWQQVRKIQDADSSVLALGMNIAVDGNRGVATSAGNKGSDHGLFILGDSGSGWTVKQKISNGRNSASKPNGNGLSRGVSISGQKIIVSGTHKMNGKDVRAAFVYESDGARFVERARILADDPRNEMFAWSVDISGNRAIVGGPDLFVDGKPFSGIAVLYEKVVANGKTVWKKIKTLEGPGGRALDKFGGAVAIDGRTIVIGADNHDLKGRNSNEGSAYVFSMPANAASSAVAGAVASRASGRSDGTTFIRLSLGARKNGYTKDKADGKTLFSAFGVIDPRTKKLLEGEVDLEYGCESPSVRKTMKIRLSGGQRQRLSIACAVIHDPRLLLLDEPTGN